MIEYCEHTLPGGLTLITHVDRTTPMVALNMLYRAGARDESPDRTGFAHLFEHLMFSGTRRFPDYDAEVNGMGGESNAFTNNDFTNYYLTVPADGLELALQLELDRMTGLDVSQRALDVQRQVVTEEYKQRYLNQPYGDVWMLLRGLCYKVHPYRWATIGADIRHVQEATLDDVRAFHARHYRPDNAILAVCGNIDSEQRVLETISTLKAKSEKREAKLDQSEKRKAKSETGSKREAKSEKLETENVRLKAEPEQTGRRELEVCRNVPSDAIYKAYHMGGRLSDDYYVCDLMTDILSNGHSSRLYDHLVRRDGLMSEVNAYITGDVDPGLLVVTGKLAAGVTMERAEAAIDAELAALATDGVSAYELEKVQNHYESTFAFSQYKAADRAYSLCYYRMLGHTGWVNSEPDNYRRVTAEQLRATAGRIFRRENENVMYYLKSE
ncbi:MAG: insulinase family protein [Bacteroidales bacterium]|nr:insulinase family protein [Bacteroidales bacterium]